MTNLEKLFVPKETISAKTAKKIKWIEKKPVGVAQKVTVVEVNGRRIITAHSVWSKEVTDGRDNQDDTYGAVSQG